MTRDQIGRSLGYKYPSDAISDIHNRYNDRLDQFSSTLKLRVVDGKLYDMIIYSIQGFYGILRYSKQPKAHAFYDWAYLCLNIRKELRASMSFQKSMTEKPVMKWTQ